MLVRKELLSPEWAERIVFWPHSGFNVHGHIFIARVTSHIPDKGQVMVRYSGLYANAHDRIIGHLKLTCVAERPPPPQVALQELLMAADPPAEYFS